jgi:hypothetical protein
MHGGLMLGCHGCRKFGFSICKGTKNKVLDLSRLGTDSAEIMNHLDNHFKVFEQVVQDNNAVNNLLEYIIKNNLVPAHMVKILYDYRAMHKPCGLYFYVETDAEYM